MRNDSSITNEHELAVAEEPTSTGNSIADIDKERIEKVQKAGLTISNAKLLEKKVIKPVSYIVDGMLAQGLTVVAGVKKGGKSFLALLLCLSVARGTDFMGFPTKQGRCLYLALEDNESRLKERMLKILGDEEAPSELDFVTDTISRLGDGLYGLLEEYVKVFPETKLIVIDTFALIRGSKNKKEGDYEFDYRETHILKQLADKYEFELQNPDSMRTILEVSVSSEEYASHTEMPHAFDKYNPDKEPIPGKPLEESRKIKQNFGGCDSNVSVENSAENEDVISTLFPFEHVNDISSLMGARSLNKYKGYIYLDSDFAPFMETEVKHFKDGYFERYILHNDTMKITVAKTLELHLNHILNNPDDVTSLLMRVSVRWINLKMIETLH